MNRLNRSLLAAAIAGGISGGVGMVGWSGNAQAVQRLAEEHWKYPHMHHAMDHLREAKTELEKAEDVFRGHREEAIEHVDNAIKNVREGLKEQRDEAATASDLPSADKYARFPHMHRALDELRDARKDLESSDKVFSGHREKAIEHADKAIKQLEEGIHDAER